MQPSEIFLRHAFHLRGIDVADNTHRDIRWRVVCVEKPLGVLHPEILDIACPAARHIAIRVRRDGRSQHLLHHLALRIRFDAHAALLAHYVAFFIKLPVYRMQKTRRLQIEPQLHAVRRKIVKVVCGIFAGAGIHSHAAVFFYDSRIEVRHNVAVRFFGGLVHRGLKCLDLFGIGFGELVALRFELVIDAFDIVHGLFFRRPVGAADGVGALESHVLEHVRQAREAFRIVYRPCVHISMERYNRRLMTFQNNEMHAVGEREFRHPFLEFGEVLGRKGSRKQQRKQKNR